MPNMNDYQFRRTRLPDGRTEEIRITWPRPSGSPNCDLRGATARKEISRWLLAAAAELAAACRFDIKLTCILVQAILIDATDLDTILFAIREKCWTPENLASEPPGGLDPENFKILLNGLLETGTVYLHEGHLRCRAG